MWLPCVATQMFMPEQKAPKGKETIKGKGSHFSEKAYGNLKHTWNYNLSFFYTHIQ